MQPELKHVKLLSADDLSRTRITQRKRWTIPYSKPLYKHLIGQNEAMDRSYMKLLEKVKALFAPGKELVFERNYRTDKTFSSVGLHAFITKSVYLELEADYLEYKCYVLYDFDHCPYEVQIRDYLQVFPIKIACKHTPQRGGVAAYFKRVRDFQGDTHFYHL